MIASKRIMAALLVAPLAAAMTPAAFAGPKDMDVKIQSLQQQLESLQAQIADLKRSQSDQYADAKKQVEEIQNWDAESDKKQKASTIVTLKSGRPTFTSADGDFTASIRGNLQADWGYYIQSAAASKLPAAYGPDLSSGSNIRRSQLGIQGKVFGDWSYNFNYDFGGSSTEAPGHILNAYLQYDGLGPWTFRIGVFAPSINLEDSTSSTDLMFLERNSPSNIQRNIAGSEGRSAISIVYAGDRLFGALSFSGGKIQDTAVFDEQQAVVGRLDYVFYKDTDASFVLGANFAHVFKLPDAVANGTATLATTPGGTALGSITLSDTPEVTVDSGAIKLVTTGSLAASHVTTMGLEAAATWQNFYVQSGYYAYEVSRAPTAYNTYSAANKYTATVVESDNNNFSSWYVQGSWIVTGESKAYVPATGAYAAPKPAKPFSLSDGTWGAWEIAARYSDTNLNDNIHDASNVVTGWTTAGSRTYTYYNTVRGGDQKIVTLGLNWYPNSAVRFLLDYQWIDVNRLQTAGTVSTTGTPSLPAVDGGQNLQTIVLRTQLAF